MALSYGFFNSISGDRLYNAESFNTFFEGLISNNGIFENVDEGLSVTAGGGMTLNVGAGKAIVDSCWMRSDAVEIITCNTAHNLFPRYDAIKLTHSVTDRTITMNYVAGTPSSIPTKPIPIRNSEQYDIILAYIFVGAGVSALTSANIQDCRYNTSLCGVITGLIDQVDTTTLYNQYQTQFEELAANMAAWQQSQEAAYNAWFNALTDDLVVNTTITESRITLDGDGSSDTIDISNIYNTGDILDIYLNNIVLMPELDYTLTGNIITLASAPRTGNTITVRVLKSQIGAIPNGNEVAY